MRDNNPSVAALQRSGSEIGDKEHIQILLAEYNTLRTEILQRNTILNQFLTVTISAGVVVTGLVTTTTAALGAAVAVPIGISVAAVIGGAIVIVLKILNFDTRAAAERVRDLEANINEIAGRRLLVWETDHGIHKVGLSARVS